MAASLATKFKLVFHVPPEALERCKTAIFAAGAGTYSGGKYTECCYTTLGIGQFRPGAGANPHTGTVGTLEYTHEARVETIIMGEDNTRSVVAALKKAHPYEEVAYEVYKCEDF